MTDHYRITLAQLNPTVGDLKGNAAKALDAWRQGRDAGAQMVALPEMFITGYQTQDLIRRRGFILAAVAEIAALADACAGGPVLMIGGPALEGVKLHNSYY
ncbi:MAG: NAD+ synthase, partial [Alphaproteobacteria bacterium]|nr:NAD+ synthase [Alphaproteobacteria bacterium]